MTEELKDSFLYMKRPVLWVLFAITTAICMGVVFHYAPTEWSVLRKVAGGLIGGTWSFMCIFANRILIA
jgi:uncharacterized membrane protein